MSHHVHYSLPLSIFFFFLPHSSYYSTLTPWITLLWWWWFTLLIKLVTWINTYNPYPWYNGEFGLGAGCIGQIRWMLLVVLWVLVWVFLLDSFQCAFGWVLYCANGWFRWCSWKSRWCLIWVCGFHMVFWSMVVVIRWVYGGGCCCYGFVVVVIRWVCGGGIFFFLSYCGLWLPWFWLCLWLAVEVVVVGS